MQNGLWGMQVSHVQTVEAGESQSFEVYQDYLHSIMPLMSGVAQDASLRTTGGRCSNMADMRYGMIHSFDRPGRKFARIDPHTVVADANCERATEFSQRTLARLLAMQLIGAGYHIKSELRFEHQDPLSQVLIGTPEGFQGYSGARVLLNGIDTRVQKVEKLTGFMQTVRTLSMEYLRSHEASHGAETGLGGSDQLAHRARLVLLAASPQRLQANPHIVKPLLIHLSEFERAGIRGHLGHAECAHSPADLAIELQSAKSSLLPR